MDNDITFTTAYSKLCPLVEAYLDERFMQEGALDDIPSLEEMGAMGKELQDKLWVEYPELQPYLGIEDMQEVSVQLYGCSCLLWLILVGAVFKKCGRRRCRRPCRPPCGGRLCEEDLDVTD